MSISSDEAAVRLLTESLVAWQVPGRLTRSDDGAHEIASDGRRIRIERASPGQPFRWLVTVDGRKRAAVSLVAVLRQLRQALDPGYATSRVRIAPAPVTDT